MKKSVSVIAFILALLLMLPTIPVFAEDETTSSQPQPVIASANLWFEGEVEMRFKMYLGNGVNADDIEYGMMFWKVPSTEIEHSYSNATDPENADKVRIIKDDKATDETFTSKSGTVYPVKQFTCSVKVTEMADVVYVQGYVINGDEVIYSTTEETYSPQIYADRMLYGANAVTNEKQRNLIIAMLNFGAAAQEYYEYNLKNLANSIIKTEVSASSIDELNKALTGSDDKLYIKLDAGTYTLGAVTNKTVTVTGSKDAVIDMTESKMNAAGVDTDGLDITFDGVTVKFDDTADYKGIQHSAKVTYTDCTLIGKQFMYADEVEFKNCTFINYEDYAVWTYGAKNVTFTGCTFLSGGKAILIYTERHEGDAAPSNNVTVNNCTFYDNGNLNTVKAAIEIGDSQPVNGLTVNLTATNNTIYGFDYNEEGTATGTKMYGNKNSIPADRLVVTASNNKEYEGAEHYVFTAEELKAALLAGGSIMLMNDIDMGGLTWNPEVNDGNKTYTAYLNGNNKTITGLKNALFNCEANATVTIKDLTISDAEIGDDYADGLGIAAFIGYMDTGCTATLTNCKLVDSKIIGTKDFPGVAGLVGYKSNNGSLTVTNCSVDGCTITGVSNAAGIVGYVASSAKIEGCAVENNTIQGENDNKTGDIVGTANGADVEIYVSACKYKSKIYGRLLAGAKLFVDGKQYIASGVVLNANGEYEISSAEGLLWFDGLTIAQQENMNVKLMADIDLGGAAWTPVGNSGTSYCGTFDGNGKTVSNFTITAPADAGANEAAALFGWSDGTIKDLTIDNVTVTGNHYAGALIGYMQSGTVENCHVKNSTITSTHMDDNKCGDKVGALIGFTNAGNCKVIGCSATNCEVTAARDAAQLIGYGYASNTYTDLSATNVTVKADATGCGHERAGVVSAYALVGNDTAGGILLPINADENGVYHIKCAADFLTLMDSFNDGESGTWRGAYAEATIELDCDIDLGGTTIERGIPSFFYGKFNGNDHTISNFVLKRVQGTNDPDGTGFTGYYTSLFGSLNGNGYVKNLKVDKAIIVGNKSVSAIVGTIWDGTVENCHVTNSTLIGIDQVGAVVGYNGSGTVTGCTTANCKLYYSRNDGKLNEDLTGDTFGVIGDNDKTASECKATDVTVKFITKPDYVITNAEEFKAYITELNNQPQNGTHRYEGADVVLISDIDLGGAVIEVSGEGYAFSGSFDGLGHTVSNYTIKRTDGNLYTGLFSVYMWNGGTIKNLTVKNGIVISNGAQVAAIVPSLNDGEGGTLLDNCHAINCTIIGEKKVGAVTGYVATGGTVSNCTASGNTIIASDTRAGQATVFGYENGGKFTNNTEGEKANTIQTGVTGTYIADGIMLNNGVYEISSAEGLANLASLVNSQSWGSSTEVTIAIMNDIDMTGVNYTTPKHDGKSNLQVDTITINGNKHVITGLNNPLLNMYGSVVNISDLTIKDSTMEKTTNNNLGYGAFLEGAEWCNVTMTNCHADNVKLTAGDTRAAVLVGYLVGKAKITGCTVNNCEVTAQGSVGGIFGHAIDNATNNWVGQVIENCTVSGSTFTSTDNGGWRVGAIIGTADGNKSLTITGCTYSGNTLAQTGKTAPGHDLYGRLVNGCTMYVDGHVYTSDATVLATALKSTDTTINITLTGDVAMDISTLDGYTGGSGQYKLGGEATTAINIDLNGYKLTLNTTYWSALGAKNSAAVITVKNGSMNSSQATGTWNSYDLTFYDCAWNFESVTFDKAVAISTGANVGMKNVTINESHDYYALWITADAGNVTLDNVTINCPNGRAIAIKDEYVKDNRGTVVLKISDSEIVSAKKAAILVTNTAGATITASNVDISGVAADSTNLVWVDENYAECFSKVSVTGGIAVVGVDDGVVLNATGEYQIFSVKGLLWLDKQVDANNTFYGKTFKLMNDIDLAGSTFNGIGADNYGSSPSYFFNGTFDGQNYTISNMTVSNLVGNLSAAGFFNGLGNNAIVKNIKFENATVTSNHMAGVVAGYCTTVSGNDVKTDPVGYIENCHVNNSVVRSIAHKLASGSYDDGDKAGGIIGFTKFEVNGCTVKKTTIVGVRDLGGIAGISYNKVSECEIENVTIIRDTTNIDRNENIDSIVGRKESGCSIESCTGTATIKSGKYNDNGIMVVDGQNLVVTMPTADLADDEKVVLNGNITGTGTVSAYSGTAAFSQKGSSGIIDGNGNTVTLSNTSYGVYTNGGTIKNLTIVGAGRGIMLDKTTGTVTIDNVKVLDCGYGLNTADHSTDAQKLIVTDSTINGWSSWAGNLESASFTGCSFGTSHYYTTEVYQHAMRPYVTTVFTNCDFDEGFYIQLDKLTGTITLDNCTCNGVKLTNANFADYVKIVTAFDASDNAIYASNGDTLTNVIFN